MTPADHLKKYPNARTSTLIRLSIKERKMAELRAFTAELHRAECAVRDALRTFALNIKRAHREGRL